MDTKAFIGKLNTIFCEINSGNKRHAQVWLSELDFGGWYNNGKYALHIKANQLTHSCHEEMRDLIYLLDEKAHDELQSIWRVMVYKPNEGMGCTGDDLLVFDEGNGLNLA